jgi:hypothetical protein
MRTGTLLGLLAAVALTTPCFAADPEKKDAPQGPTLEQKIDFIKGQLDNLTQSMLRVTDLSINVASMQRDMNDLKARLERLEREMDQARRERRSSFYEPPTTGTMGTLRLSNRFVEPATIIVNGRAYRLVPGETRTISVPAGTYTFETLVDRFGQIQGEVLRSIQPGEARAIEVYPR